MLDKKIIRFLLISVVQNQDLGEGRTRDHLITLKLLASICSCALCVFKKHSQRHA